MENQLKSWLQSSQDPAQVANTVKGLVLGASSFIILGASLFFHVTLTTENVVEIAGDLGLLVGAVWTVYGIVMKGVMWFGKKAS